MNMINYAIINLLVNLKRCAPNYYDAVGKIENCIYVVISGNGNFNFPLIHQGRRVSVSLLLPILSMCAIAVSIGHASGN